MAAETCSSSNAALVLGSHFVVDILHREPRVKSTVRLSIWGRNMMDFLAGFLLARS